MLREYNIADVEPFMEALDKTRRQYYPTEIDILMDAVSIPGISMNYVLNKALRWREKNELELYAAYDPCTHKCKQDRFKNQCTACNKVKKECKKCSKNATYELLKTGIAGGPCMVFFRYAEHKKM